MIIPYQFRNFNILTWYITSKCNYKCDYCFAPIEKDSKNKEQKEIDLADIEAGFNVLGENWIIHITGGEPFVKKDFIHICDKLSENHLLSLNTNLSLPSVFEFADIINPKRVATINAALHILEREKKDPDLKAFLNTVTYLQKKLFNVIVTYVAHPTMLHRMKEDLAFLKENGVEKTRMKTFRGVFKNKAYPVSYSESDIQFISSFESEHPELDVINDKYSFYWKECRAGMNFFVMDQFGKLERCSALSRSYGNLIKNNFNPDKKPRPCPIFRCGCPYEGIRFACENSAKVLSIVNESLKEGSLLLSKLNNRDSINQFKGQLIKQIGKK